jgi:hypothetical protein
MENTNLTLSIPRLSRIRAKPPRFLLFTDTSLSSVYQKRILTRNTLRSTSAMRKQSVTSHRVVSVTVAVPMPMGVSVAVVRCHRAVVVGIAVS